MRRIALSVLLLLFGCIDPPSSPNNSNNTSNNSNSSNNNDTDTNNVQTTNNASNNQFGPVATYRWTHGFDTPQSDIPVYFEIPFGDLSTETVVRVEADGVALPTKSHTLASAIAVWALAETTSKAVTDFEIVIGAPSSDQIWGNYLAVHHFERVESGDFVSEVGDFPVTPGDPPNRIAGKFAAAIELVPNQINQFTMQPISVAENSVLTIELWYAEEFNLGKTIILSQAAPCRGWELSISDAGDLEAAFGYFDGNGCAVVRATFASVPRDVEWHQMVASFDRINGMLSLYFDGELRDEVPISPIGDASGETVVFGSGRVAAQSDWAFQGALDEVRFSTQPVTEELVAAMFSAANDIVRTD